MRHLSGRFDERDFVDLFQRGDARLYFIKRRLAQEAHSFVAGSAADLRGGLLGQDHLAHAIAEIEQFVDGGTTFEARARALDAAFTFAKHYGLPNRRIEATIEQGLAVVVDVFAAMVADHTDEALGQDAIQGGDEVIRINAHVEETPEHVNDIVCVHGGEHQVAGKGRLNGDLRSLGVADLADHDLVWVMAQDGAQSTSEGESLLLVDRDLGDAPDLIFNRVFDGNKFVFVALDLVELGIESSRLTAA